VSSSLFAICAFHGLKKEQKQKRKSRCGRLAGLIGNADQKSDVLLGERVIVTV
jgi:hypothetical protein